MAQAQGALARFAYVPESTWGTTPGSPSMKKLGAAVYGESLGANYEELISNAISSSRDREDMRLGNLTVSGAIPFEFAPLGLGTLLKHALGANTTTGTNPYTHTMKTGSTFIGTGLSVEKAFIDLNKYFVFTGGVIEGISATITADGLCTGSMDLLGKGWSNSGSALGTPAAVAHNPFAPFEAAFQEGGTDFEVLSWGFALRNNIEVVRGPGSREILGVNAGKADVTTTCTIRYQNHTHLDKWLAETITTQRCTFTTGANSLQFLFPRGKYSADSSPKIQTDQGIVTQLNFRGLRDSTEATSMKVTLINTEATV